MTWKIDSASIRQEGVTLAPSPHILYSTFSMDLSCPSMPAPTDILSSAFLVATKTNKWSQSVDQATLGLTMWTWLASSPSLTGM